MITGGAGFIGSHVVRLFVKKYPDYNIVNVDCLTYAGNLENLIDIDQCANYSFVKADICDDNEMDRIFREFKITHVVHLAAESHVDRSIKDPMAFVRTNVFGTVNLLNMAVKHWSNNKDNDHLFYHVSTDEVYGSLGKEGLFTESTPYDPKSPYSSSKASSDHFVRSYYNTYKLPVVISNCSNNYGPNQFPEKLIPLCINNILNNNTIPVYGKGENIRDWLYVVDHAQAIDKIFHEGSINETYNIGGLNEWTNLNLVYALCDTVDEAIGREMKSSRALISFVEDRAGHDMRYAIDASKIETNLGWTPEHNFESGLKETVLWYLDNKDWLNNVTSGSYHSYYDSMHKQ